MYSTIKIECIGAVPNPVYMAIDKMFGLGYSECFKKRYWVAEITGTDPKFGFKREFLNPKHDFTKSNSKGSRGVYASYFLEYGKVYEISSPVSWKNTDRYFLIAGENNKRMSKEEVVEWLKSK